MFKTVHLLQSEREIPQQIRVLCLVPFREDTLVYGKWIVGFLDQILERVRRSKEIPKINNQSFNCLDYLLIRKQKRSARKT